MRLDSDSFSVQTQPQYLQQTAQILAQLRQLDYAAAQKLWRCNDKIARANYQWLQEMDLTAHQTPALFSYNGIQYSYMAPDVMTQPALDYVQNNLRILSGFYGILRPFDGIVPYRLEMQAHLTIKTKPNLYAYWGDRLYQALTPQAEPIINLASQEYAKAITPYLAPKQPMIDVAFASLVNGQLKVKATLAKMARGAMVRFLAEHQITEPADLKFFDHPDYRFDASQSTPTKFVFIYQK